MITRVEDRRGNVLHDCAAERCTGSWDGIDLDNGLAVAGASDDLGPGIVKEKGGTVVLDLKARR
jgi:hypothetical protein